MTPQQATLIKAEINRLTTELAKHDLSAVDRPQALSLIKAYHALCELATGANTNDNRKRKMA